MTPTPNIERSRQAIVTVYRDLPKLDQRIIQLFSVIYEPISQSAFLKCLNHVNTQQTGNKLVAIANKLVTIATIRPHIEKLLSTKLLIQERTQVLKCDPLLVEIATRDAVKEGNFEIFANMLEDCIPISSGWIGNTRRFSGKVQLIREVRIGIYRKDLGTGSVRWDGYNHYPERVRLHIELLVVATKIIQLPEFLALQQEQL